MRLLLASAFAVLHAGALQNAPPASQSTVAAPRPARQGYTLEMLFQGGALLRELRTALDRLRVQSLLPLETTQSHSQERVEDVYLRETTATSLDLPTLLFREIASDVNGLEYPDSALAPGTTVLYPRIMLSSFQFSHFFDPTRPDDRARLDALRKQWPSDLLKETSVGSMNKLDLRSYRLELELDTPDQLNQAIDVLRRVSDPDVRLMTEKVPLAEPTPSVSVLLEGGDVVKDASRVVRALLRAKLIGLVDHEVQPGEYVERIYRDALKLPFSLIGLADKVNGRKYEEETLARGQHVLVPDIRFTASPWHLTLDPRSDAALLQDIRANWGFIKLGERSLEGGLLRIDLLRFRTTLLLDTEEMLRKARAVLEPLRSGNVILVFPDAGSQAWNALPPAQVSPRLSPPTDFLREAGNRGFKVPEGEEADIGEYLSLDTPPEYKCDDQSCPYVVLLDQRVPLHADVAGALIDDEGRRGSAETLVKDGTAEIKVSGFNRKLDHGTHLAGIVGAQHNGFGVVGVDPRASIYPMDWSYYRNNLFPLKQQIEQRSNRSNLQIYLFANERLLDKRGLEDGADHRFDDSIAKTIRETANSLWVVAAGQETPAQDGEPARPRRSITRQDRIGLMCLGDLPNVIVVTACDPCSGPSARIASWANSSTEDLVHLAATGEPILSTATSNSYALGKGTSEAAALVAGVASGMAAGFPAYYANYPARIKLRLQQTATVFPDPDGRRRVTAGVVNAELALRNPMLHYVDRNDGKLVEVAAKKWLKAILNLVEPDGAVKAVWTSQIRRLKRESDVWLVYCTTPPAQGLIKVTEAQTIGDPNEAIVALQDGNTLKPQGFADLVIGRQLDNP